MSIVINGALTAPEQATVSIFDRGFQYGDGLYETIAVVGGKPLFWSEHLARMTTGANILGIPMPGADVWERDAALAIDGSTERVVLKLTLTRGVGGRGYARPFGQLPTRIAHTSAWPRYPAANWRAGVEVVTCHTAQLGGSSFATVKSLNRLNQVLARAELPDDAPEGLLLDTAGMLREGTFTNVIWMRSGRACTPRLTDTGIPGIMRAAITARLSERGISCDAVDAPPSILTECAECFVSNSLIGLWPIRSVDRKPVRNAIGPVTRDLLTWIESLGLGPDVAT